MTRMRATLCPKCGSSDIGLFAGGVTGTYECKNCGYVGDLVMDKETVKK